jgi:hypothetical protein
VHVDEIGSVSHRWLEPDEPDPDGAQLLAIKSFLSKPEAQKIKLIWIDAQCMPQDKPKGSRNEEDTAAFKRMLAQVNMLYLGTTVLILLDLSYVSRFWTQFECWCSMQSLSQDGLSPAAPAERRCTIVPILGANSSLVECLLAMWGQRTPEEAYSLLGKPDVTVTNLRDKDRQLPKILRLDERVRAVLSRPEGQAPSLPSLPLPPSTPAVSFELEPPSERPPSDRQSAMLSHV